MSKLFPTIVIGLGTFGGDIVNILRTLVYEELDKPGLPIFRFVHMSSHEKDEVTPMPSNYEGNNPWELLHVLKCTLPTEDITRIKSIINEEQSLHLKEPGWKEWIDDSILDMTSQGFLAGAGHIRMIGRAILWNNWRRKANVSRSLMSFAQAITNDQRVVTETNEVLKRYYQRKTGDNPPDAASFVETTRPRVYIVGSLCGGTCSGMFLDLAYFFQTYGGLGFKVFGIFSIPDTRCCDDGNKDRLAANAYAALKELDFFMQNGTRYSVILSESQKRTISNDQPFDYVQLVSPTLKSKKLLGRSHVANRETLEELAHIVASSMFFDLLRGTAEQRAGIHIDYFADRDGWMQKRQAGPGYLKGMSTFGAATAHYPKYRIAGAAACQLITEKIFEWTGKVKVKDIATGEDAIRDKERKGRLPKDVASKWLQDAFNKGKQILSAGSKGTGSLRQEWKAEFLKYFMPQNSPIQVKALDLLNLLANTPDNDPIPARFVLGGRYADLLLSDQRKQSFRETMIDNFKESFSEALTSIVGDRSSDSPYMPNSLNALREVIDSLCGEVLDEARDRIVALASKPVDATFLNDVFQEFEQAEDSLAAHLIKAKVPIRNYYRSLMIQRFLNRLDKEHNKLEDACLKEIIMDLRKDLEHHLRNPLNQLINKTEQSLRLLDKEYQDLINLREYENWKYIVRDRVKGISHDVDECKHLFMTTMWADVFSEAKKRDSRGRTIKEQFLDPKADHTIIIDRLMDQVVRKLMGAMDISGFSIVKELVENYSLELTAMAKRSEVLLEFVPTYIDLFRGDHPRLICGGNSTDLIRLLTHLNREDINDFDDIKGLDTEMDHMLHFYQEEGGIAIDELDNFACMESKYYEYRNSRQTEARVVHIDRDPSKFEISRYHRVEELKRNSGPGKPSLIDIANRFINDLVFTSRPNAQGHFDLLFEWQDRGLSYDALYDPEKPEDFLWEVAQTEVGSTCFKRKIYEILDHMDETEMTSRHGTIREQLRARYPPNSVLEFQEVFNTDFVHKRDFPWWQI
jgi:hypothetical protein